MEIPDSVYAAAGSAIVAVFGAYLAFRSKHAELSAAREKTLNEIVDDRIKLLLEQNEKNLAARDAHIDELKDEVESLRITLDRLIDIVRRVIERGGDCPRVSEGRCLIDHSTLAGDFAQAIARGHA